MKQYMNDSISYAFSSAFSIEPGFENQKVPHRIRSDSEDISVNEGEESNYWYVPSTCTKISTLLGTRVKFSSGTKPPPINNKPQGQTEFQLRMNLVCKDDKENNLAVVYDGVSTKATVTS